VVEVTVNISLGTPYILIPSGKNNFTSRDHILIDLGKLSLQTTFPKEKECSKYLISLDHFQIVLKEQLDEAKPDFTDSRLLSGTLILVVFYSFAFVTSFFFFFF
jgi:hypothetical protein